MENNRFSYPETKKDNITEDFHGTRVSDPYRWLEDPSSEETANWVDAQNKITRAFLDSVPARNKIKERLTGLWNYPKYSIPYKEGNRYFFFKNDGLQNQAVLYVQHDLISAPEQVIDPNKLSPDGTVALMTHSFSDDGKFLAYGLSKSGSDQQEIKIRDIDNKTDLPEVINWCKFSGVAWKTDNSGFFYNRYPRPGTVPPEDESNYSQVFFHKLGTEQSEDILVYEDQDNKELGFYPMVSSDGKYLGLFVFHGTDNENRFYYRETESSGSFIKLFDKADANYGFIDSSENTMFFKTDLDAPKGKVISVDLRNPENIVEIIPEQNEVMTSVSIVNNNFVVIYMKDAHHIIRLYNLDGSFIKELELPSLGSVEELSGKKNDKELFLRFTSFVYPSVVLRYDFNSGKPEVYRESEISFDASAYETTQVFYPSKDGTKIPMFLTHKKGLKPDGNNPVLLYGYGGFKVNMMPSFSIARLVWLEYGGIYAVVNLRGGGEYGEDWHKAGQLENKQNVFDDFIYAGKWLIENNYTCSAKLAIQGGSNGGLLTAACMVQQPKLFGAVICSVPVIDMLRYHKFTVGRFWTGEYGNAEKNAEHFNFMYAYSPLHNVKKTDYPPILITTADTDDRVVPAHAYKFAAVLQEHNTSRNPSLLRVDVKAGHGAGKPTAKVIEEQSDIYAFLFRTLNIS